VRNIGIFLLKKIILLVSILPYWVLYIFSDILAFWGYHLRRYRRKVVNQNLKNSFPEKSDKEIKRLEKDFYLHFSDTIFEALKSTSLSKREQNRRVKFLNPEIFQKYYDLKRDVVLVAGHYANWELFAFLPQHIPQVFYSIFKPLRSEFITKLFTNIRSKNGCILLPMNDVLRPILRAKQKASSLVMLMIADQAPPQETPYWLDFLNQDTPLFAGVEKIGRKLKAAMIFAKVQKIKRGYYTVEFLELSENISELPEGVPTKLHAEVLEEIIKENPSAWLWSHRRWKHKREIAT